MSHEAHAHHPTSPQLLWATFIALVALTGLTVMVASINISEINTTGWERFSPLEIPNPLDISWLDMPITLTIATAKALLVAVIFMHLSGDKLFNSILLIGATIFLVLFIGMVVLDSAQYGPQVDSYQDDKIEMQNP